MSDFHFIYNPVAGHGMSAKAFSKMVMLLDESGVNYSIAITEYPRHAIKLTHEAQKAGHSCIVAVGGDGTVREVAEAMNGSNIPMCLLPCGTGNDMARSLKIPTEPEALLDLLLTGKPKAIDAALANDNFYFNVAGLGFDVDVLANTEHYKRNFKGLTAYMLGLLTSLFKMKLNHVLVTTKDGTKEYDALIVAAANGTHFGGGMNVAPLADPSDGMLDVCILSDVTIFTVIGALIKFVKGKHISLPITTYFKAQEITVTGCTPIKTQLDGEIVGETPVTFKILPGALQVITPQ